MSDETELRISGDNLPPTAVRGITELLEPINNPQFDKYRLLISCSDINAPAFDRLRVGNWRRTVNGGLVDLSGKGSIVTIECMSELAYQTAGGGSPPSAPQRTPVAGSSRVSGDYTFYRPEMLMGLISKTQNTDEAGAVVSWEAEFEEI